MTPVRRSARSEIVWGGVDQGLSSATNLGLSIVAGRLLGAAGLGRIFLGFSTFLLVLSILRGFITAPFVIATSALEPAERDAATRKCITLIFGAAGAVSLLMLVIGLVVPDPLGRSFVAFAPWVAVGIVQDLWRSILFRDERGSAAAFNDGVWAAGMVVMLPFVWAYPHDWSVAAMWGMGAALAAIVGWRQVGLRPGRPTDAIRWWNLELRRLGSWLAMDSVLNAAGSQVVIIVLASILSASEIGGIRVVQVVFAPMTLINEAFNFPGVPLMARALTSSLAAARRWAWRLGLAAVAIVGVYLAIILPFSDQVLSRVFGPEFEQFTSLVLPTALGQIPVAATIGFGILLKADRRGHAIVVLTAIRTVAIFVFTPLLAINYGALGAVWGFTVGVTISAVAALYFGLLTDDISLRNRRVHATEEP